MRRPKLAEMSPLEQGRWRALQIRRTTQRALDHWNAIDPSQLSSEERAKLTADIAHAKTVIALTKPAWVRSASRAELLAVLSHLLGHSPAIVQTNARQFRPPVPDFGVPHEAHPTLARDPRPARRQV